jgi:hypothetical protein
MRKLQLFVTMLVLLMASLAFSQTLMDYVAEQRGDTLVIKDYSDMGGLNNSLYFAMTLDIENVPAGRVYMLKTSGYYPLLNSPNTLRPTVIVGQTSTPLVQIDDPNTLLPLVCGAVSGDQTNTGGIGPNHNLTMKNLNLNPSNQNLGFGWAFSGTGGDGVGIWVDNCLFERTRWVFLVGNNVGNIISIKNSYFVNMTGQPCRRNGGVYDGWNWKNDMLVENTTHIHAQGSIYKLRANVFEKVRFNHNNFINCAGYVILDLGYQKNMATTNNIFVNSNLQPYSGLDYDTGEFDIDHLPLGLVNARPLTFISDTLADVPRKIYFDKNVAYWDPSMLGTGITGTLNANKVNGVDTWVSQTIIMNTRSQQMFDDDATYPYLTEGTTYNELPNFADPKDLLTTQAAAAKAFAIATSDTASTAVMADWRLTSVGDANFLYCDWPIPVDLSYDNATLLSGGLGGFPVGDLNWFPSQKAAWDLQRDDEYAAIQNALDGDTGIGKNEPGSTPVDFKLRQNYPNPFNPTTTIEFSVPKSGVITLKVYDALGQEVATLVNGFKNANETHRVEFDGSKHSSGIYIYKLSDGNYQVTKKMMLVK